MNTDLTQPKRGDIWQVNFDPTIGEEIQKIRPAVVISADAIGKLAIKLVAPITGWNETFTNNLWHIRLDPDEFNGLSKVSAVDALQLRGMDRQRFLRRLGYIVAPKMQEITAAITLVIDA